MRLGESDSGSAGSRSGIRAATGTAVRGDLHPSTAPTSPAARPSAAIVVSVEGQSIGAITLSDQTELALRRSKQRAQVPGHTVVRRGLPELGRPRRLRAGITGEQPGGESCCPARIIPAHTIVQPLTIHPPDVIAIVHAPGPNDFVITIRWQGSLACS